MNMADGQRKDWMKTKSHIQVKTEDKQRPYFQHLSICMCSVTLHMTEWKFVTFPYSYNFNLAFWLLDVLTCDLCEQVFHVVCFEEVQLSCPCFACHSSSRGFRTAESETNLGKFSNMHNLIDRCFFTILCLSVTEIHKHNHSCEHRLYIIPSPTVPPCVVD